MNIKTEDRTLRRCHAWPHAFPYMNGGLFSGSMEVPRFSRIARSYLLHVGMLDWTKINPDIFGSMIQAVADDDERRRARYALAGTSPRGSAPASDARVGPIVPSSRTPKIFLSDHGPLGPWMLVLVDGTSR